MSATENQPPGPHNPQPDQGEQAQPQPTPVENPEVVEQIPGEGTGNEEGGEEGSTQQPDE